MKLKIMLFATTAVAAMTAAAAANEARIEQRPGLDAGTAQIATYTINQKAGGGNRIEGTDGGCCGVSFGTTAGSFAIIQGSLGVFSVNQDGDGNVMGISIAGKNASTAGSVVVDVEGDGNLHRLVIGNLTNPGPSHNFLNPNYKLEIVGDGNQVSDVLRGGPAGTLVYDGRIEGNGNDVGMNGSNAGATISYAYEIEGSSNKVRVLGSSGVNVTRIVDLKVDGSGNDIEQKASGGTTFSSFVAEYTGMNITSRVDQAGVGPLDVTSKVTHLGAALFEHSITQSGINQSVNSTVTALDGGSYSITQSIDSPGALFADTVTLAAGGTGAVTQ